MCNSYFWQYKEIDDDRDYIAQQKGYEDYADYMSSLEDDYGNTLYEQMNNK